MGSIVLLDLMGGVALLLWGLHMVRSGIMRAFGSELRHVLSTALRNRFLALLAGIGVTRSGAVIRHLGACASPVSRRFAGIQIKLAGQTMTRDLGRVAIGPARPLGS
jgi:Na+/Pi-cotransporter